MRNFRICMSLKPTAGDADEGQQDLFVTFSKQHSKSTRTKRYTNMKLFKVNIKEMRQNVHTSSSHIADRFNPSYNRHKASKLIEQFVTLTIIT